MDGALQDRSQVGDGLGLHRVDEALGHQLTRQRAVGVLDSAYRTAAHELQTRDACTVLHGVEGAGLDGLDELEEHLPGNNDVAQTLKRDDVSVETLVSVVGQRGLGERHLMRWCGFDWFAHNMSFVRKKFSHYSQPDRGPTRRTPSHPRCARRLSPRLGGQGRQTVETRQAGGLHGRGAIGHGRAETADLGRGLEAAHPGPSRVGRRDDGGHGPDQVVA